MIHRLVISCFCAVMLLCCKYANAEQMFVSDKLSSTKITAICQDKVGYMWIGTEYGLNRFDGYRFVHFLNVPDDSTSLYSNVVEYIFCDSDGRLWIGTSTSLVRYDYATNSFEHFHFPKGRSPRVNSIVETKDGKLLVGTSGYGLYQVVSGSNMLKELFDYRIDDQDNYFNHMYEDAMGGFWKSGANRFSYKPRGGKMQMFRTRHIPLGFFELEGRTIAMCRDTLFVYDNGRLVPDFIDVSAIGGKAGFLAAMKDNSGNIYLGTNGNGLWWIPAGSRRLQRHTFIAHGFDLATSIVTSLAEDRQGNIWVGCKHKGVTMIPGTKDSFQSWSFSRQKHDIGTYVSSMCEGDDGIVWCTVRSNGVYGFDATGRIVATPSAPQDVELIYRDCDGRFWLGTVHGVFAYDPKTGSSRLLTDVACSSFNAMVDNGKGYLAISAFSKGMLVYNKQTGSMRHLDMSQTEDSVRGRITNNWITCFTADRDGRIWIGTPSGVSCYDPEADTFRPFGWQELNTHLPCFDLQETLNGDILIATDQGIMHWQRSINSMQPLKGAEQLQRMEINDIEQDRNGDLWCSTSMGIWHYHSDTGKWSSYAGGYGLTKHEYVNSVGLHTNDDRIFFATSDGLCTFRPEQLVAQKETVGTLMLTAFRINAQPVSTLSRSDGNPVTLQPIEQSRRFCLSYLDNSFSLEFSLLDFANAANVVFEHRLSNSDAWIATSAGENSIVFNHLPSGTYKLEVRAVSNGSVTAAQVYEIHVSSPWYSTPLAYIVYILLLLSFIFMAALYYKRRLRHRFEEEKMKFLINATHDIRSPLTMIMGPLGKLRNKTTDESMQTELSVIERNAQRIQQLVNQILDVRKIDKQQMHLRCRETNMQEFLQANHKFFEHYANERNIKLSLEMPSDEEPIMAWIDRRQFEKVISNLLSNAFKYSYDHGEIVVSLSAGTSEKGKSPLKDYIEITVSDTGTGMQPNALQHLFDRFYQGKTSSSAHTEGTGIGLNLCKMIVDMHHGTISGGNRQDGRQGSIFVVRIPKGNGHLAEKEIDREQEQPATLQLKSNKPSSNSRVLIVDDDEEIGQYIGNELSGYYHFTLCRNGKDGLKELLSDDYDLVISDVMMPEMDGFTMLRMIRSNGMINHLPVIMLTSKTDIDNRLKGLEKGADAYLTKPFSIDELHALIDNLISSRLRLRGKFSGVQNPVEKVKDIEVKGNDEQLMERIISSINAHISDSDFNIETLCSEAGISRSHLHRKMKEMTGMAISDFIRNIRMEQAARLLIEQKLNITQVAYKVGYSTLAHFSSVFHKHFGLSPKAFIEREASKS